MNHAHIQAVIQGILPEIKAIIIAANKPLVERIRQIEAREPVRGEPGRDGKSITLEEVRPLVSEAVAALPRPLDGKSVSLEDVRPVLQGMVDAIPRPQDGKSVSLEEALPALQQLVADLPLPRDGKSVTVDEVAPIISAEVARQVAQLPPPEAGKSISIDDVRPLLAEMVAALPPAQDGKSVTVDDLRPMLSEEVHNAVVAAVERALEASSTSEMSDAEFFRRVNKHLAPVRVLDQNHTPRNENNRE